MHNSIQNEVVQYGVAKEFNAPVWKDESGSICTKGDSFGHPCTINVVHPDYCLAAAEVGASINMKGDGHAAGTRLLYERESVPKK